MERPIYIKGKVFPSGGSYAIRASKILVESGVLHDDEEVTLVRVTPEIKELLEGAYQQKALKTANGSKLKNGPVIESGSPIVLEFDESGFGCTNWSVCQPMVQPHIY